MVTFVHQQVKLLERKSNTIEGLSTMVEQQAMINKRQSTLIQQMRKEHESQMQVPIFQYISVLNILISVFVNALDITQHGILTMSFFHRD